MFHCVCRLVRLVNDVVGCWNIAKSFIPGITSSLYDLLASYNCRFWVDIYNVSFCHSRMAPSELSRYYGTLIISQLPFRRCVKYLNIWTSVSLKITRQVDLFCRHGDRLLFERILQCELPREHGHPDHDGPVRTDEIRPMHQRRLQRRVFQGHQAPTWRTLLREVIVWRQHQEPGWPTSVSARLRVVPRGKLQMRGRWISFYMWCICKSRKNQCEQLLSQKCFESLN